MSWVLILQVVILMVVAYLIAAALIDRYFEKKSLYRLGEMTGWDIAQIREKQVESFYSSSSENVD